MGLTDRLMKLDEVLGVGAFSKSHLRRLIDRGEFPQPVMVGERSPRWRQSEVLEWLESLQRGE